MTLKSTRMLAAVAAAMTTSALTFVFPANADPCDISITSDWWPNEYCDQWQNCQAYNCINAEDDCDYCTRDAFKFRCFDRPSVKCKDAWEEGGGPDPYTCGCGFEVEGECVDVDICQSFISMGGPCGRFTCLN
jgi:hypothetical protein